jgi:small subunit ribosomal protein S8
MMQDSVCDLIVRLKTGHMARKTSVKMQASKLRGAILDVLAREGYIRSYTKETVRKGVEQFEVQLKYYEGQPVIQRIRAVSTPGRRVYRGVADLPRVHNGLGVLVVSTPKGVLSDVEARTQNVGGEVLLEVF